MFPLPAHLTSIASFEISFLPFFSFISLLDDGFGMISYMINPPPSRSTIDTIELKSTNPAIQPEKWTNTHDAMLSWFPCLFPITYLFDLFQYHPPFAQASGLNGRNSKPG